MKTKYNDNSMHWSRCVAAHESLLLHGAHITQNLLHALREPACVQFECDLAVLDMRKKNKTRKLDIFGRSETF